MTVLSISKYSKSGSAAQKLMQLLEDASISPARKAFIYSIPIAVFLGQQAPLRARASDPKDGGEEAATLPVSADVNLAARAQEGQNLLPLLICKRYW